MAGIAYRKLALEHYPKICVYCGFGISEILEVAHLDQNRSNNDLSNLAILCPNCHKMHDIGLIPTDVIKLMRDERRDVNWKLRIKDAPQKAVITKGTEGLRIAAQKAVKNRDSKAAAQKAVETRRRNREIEIAEDLLQLRGAKNEEGDAPTISLSEVKNALA